MNADKRPVNRVFSLRLSQVQNPPSSTVNHQMGRDRAGTDMLGLGSCVVVPLRGTEEEGRCTTGRQDLTVIAGETGSGVGCVCGRCGVSRLHFVNTLPSFLPCKPAQSTCSLHCCEGSIPPIPFPHCIWDRQTSVLPVGTIRVLYRLHFH